MKRIAALVVVLSLVAPLLIAGLDNRKAKYVGGTMKIREGAEGFLDVSAEEAAVFKSKKETTEIPYSSITSIEYGQKAGRRVGVAIAVTWVALFSKKRKHYLTVGYNDASGQAQAGVFELGKSVAKITLVSLSTRSGVEVEYESEEARKHVNP